MYVHTYSDIDDGGEVLNNITENFERNGMHNQYYYRFWTNGSGNNCCLFR